jgi:hypothetical protein
VPVLGYPRAMFAAPQHGFVFLSTTKTGSTAVENVFTPYAQLVARRPPSLKHMNAQGYAASLQPLLAKHGFPRETYDVVCVIREPIDWITSWWRYRSRPAAAEKEAKKYAGDLTLDEFCERFMDGEFVLGNMARFVRLRDGSCGVDVMFKYDHLDDLVVWMSEKIGIDVPHLPPANVSPPREDLMSAGVRARLEEHMAEHRSLYEAAR